MFSPRISRRQRADRYIIIRFTRDTSSSNAGCHSVYDYVSIGRARNDVITSTTRRACVTTSIPNKRFREIEKIEAIRLFYIISRWQLDPISKCQKKKKRNIACSDNKKICSAFLKRFSMNETVKYCFLRTGSKLKRPYEQLFYS